MRTYRAEHTQSLPAFPFFPLGHPCSSDPRASTQEKPVAKGSIGPIHGRCQGWARLRPAALHHAAPCGQGICRTGVRGTSRQGKGVGASPDQVGTLSTNNQKDFPISA